MSALSPQQDEQIRDLLKTGNKIAAIKYYREITAVGLKEAKDAIESTERGEPVSMSKPASSGIRNDALLEEQVKRLLFKRKKIEAIKIYREAHNCGLKDAKDSVDIIEVQMRREARTSLPSSNDPFAEDTQRSRIVLILVFTFVLLIIGGLIFFFITGTGF